MAQISRQYLTLSQWLEGFGIANIVIFIVTAILALVLEKGTPVAFPRLLSLTPLSQ